MSRHKTVKPAKTKKKVFFYTKHKNMSRHKTMKPAKTKKKYSSTENTKMVLRNLGLRISKEHSR